MPATADNIFNAASSLARAAQGGFELGSSKNAYTAYTNALNLAGTMAGSGPWATGINLAATSNNTLAAVSAYSRGALQPSDVLQITASALSLVAAAAAISGAPITLSAIVLAGTIGIIAGPGPLREQFNEYATKIGRMMSSGLLGSAAFNAAELSASVGGTQGEGHSMVLHEYAFGSGDLVTIEFIDRLGISHGEYGVATGNAKVGVVTNGGTFWTVEDSNGNVVREYFEASTPSSTTDRTLSLSGENWRSGLDNASTRVDSGVWGWNSGSGNNADYIAGIGAAAGLGYGDLATVFGPSSTTGQFFEEMDWFSQLPEFYQEIWTMGRNADLEGEVRLRNLQKLEAKLGKTERHDEITERVGWGIASPIAVDLDGDGLQTSSTEESGVVFDITGDGVAERTGWIESSDAFLAIDRNANGRIDGVNELFGGMSRGVGYAKLRLLDSDGDSWVSTQEADAAGLLLWRDSDGDGITDEGELEAASMRLSSIEVDYVCVDQLNNGNLIGEVSRASSAGGSVVVGDIYFRYQSLPAEGEALLPAFGSRNIGAQTSATRVEGADALAERAGTAEGVEWHDSASLGIESFQAVDGKVPLAWQVHPLIDAMASFAPPAAGQTTPPSQYASSLPPPITANWQ